MGCVVSSPQQSANPVTQSVSNAPSNFQSSSSSSAQVSAPSKPSKHIPDPPATAVVVVEPKSSVSSSVTDHEPSKPSKSSSGDKPNTNSQSYQSPPSSQPLQLPQPSSASESSIGIPAMQSSSPPIALSAVSLSVSTQVEHVTVESLPSPGSASGPGSQPYQPVSSSSSSISYESKQSVSDIPVKNPPSQPPMPILKGSRFLSFFLTVDLITSLTSLLRYGIPSHDQISAVCANEMPTWILKTGARLWPCVSIANPCLCVLRICQRIK